MTTGLFDTDGRSGGELSGIESRTLRALLGLERRHVAILAEIASGEDVTTERVTQWERSKGRGYPDDLVTMLRSIQRAVAALGRDLRAVARKGGGDGRVTILRPRGAHRVLQALDLGRVLGRHFSEPELQALDDGGGDFWQRLADAAVCEAVTVLGYDFKQAGVRCDIHIAYELADD